MLNAVLLAILQFSYQHPRGQERKRAFRRERRDAHRLEPLVRFRGQHRKSDSSAQSVANKRRSRDEEAQSPAPTAGAARDSDRRHEGTHTVGNEQNAFVSRVAERVPRSGKVNRANYQKESDANGGCNF